MNKGGVLITNSAYADGRALPSVCMYSISYFELRLERSIYSFNDLLQPSGQTYSFHP